MRDEQGRRAASREESTNIWADFYEKLGQGLSSGSAFDEGTEKEVKEHIERLRKDGSEWIPGLSEVPSEAEVLQAVKILKRGKAAGPDGIRNEMLMEGGPSMVSALTRLFRLVWIAEKVPSDWQTGSVVPIFKDGQRDDPSNYRPITLTSCVAKVFESIIDKRLSRRDAKDKTISDLQGGFRKGKGTNEHLFLLSEIVEKAREKSKPLYVCMIDIKKAYDTVWREGMLLKLWKNGIRGKMWKVIDALHEDVKARVQVDSMLSRLFALQVGVRQGSVVSPALFNHFVNDLIKELEALGIGVKIGDRTVPALFYADDICLLATSPADLQRLLDVVSEFARKWRLTYNLSKTKVIPFCVAKKELDAMAKRKVEFKLSGGTVELVNDYKYLGVEFQKRRGWKLVQNRLCQSARSSISQVMWMARQSDGVRPETGRKLYEALVRPILEYGCEFWTTNKKEAESLEKVQRRALRRIAGCRDSTKISMLMNELGVTSLQSRRDIAVLRLFNKLKSYDKGTILHTVFRDRMSTAAKKKDGRGLCSRALRLLDKYSLSYAAGVDDVWKQSVWNESITKKISESEIGAREDELRQEADVMEKERAKFYLSLHPAFASSLPAYLRVPPRRVPDARLHFQLRVGVSDLRAHCFGVAQACPLCEAPTEDTVHFMIHCPAYHDLKERMLSKITSRAKKFGFSPPLDDPSSAAAFLLSSSRPGCPPHLDKEMTRHAQRFIATAFRRRREMIQHADFRLQTD